MCASAKRPYAKDAIMQSFRPRACLSWSRTRPRAQPCERLLDIIARLFAVVAPRPGAVMGSDTLARDLRESPIAIGSIVEELRGQEEHRPDVQRVPRGTWRGCRCVASGRLRRRLDSGPIDIAILVPTATGLRTRRSNSRRPCNYDNGPTLAGRPVATVGDRCESRLCIIGSFA